jgi:hypothetical protein
MAGATDVLRSNVRVAAERLFVAVVDDTVRGVQDAARTPGALDVAPGFKNPSGETAASIRVTEIRAAATQFTATLEATSDGAFFTNLGQVLTPNTARALSWIDRQTGGRVFARYVDMTPYAGWFGLQAEHSFNEALRRVG